MNEKLQVYDFIENCSLIDLGRVIAQIIYTRNNLQAFDWETGKFSQIQLVSINGNSIQLSFNVPEDLKMEISK